MPRAKVACLLALAVLCLAAATATPVQASGRQPSDARAAGHHSLALTAPPGPSKEVFGFALAQDLGNPATGYQSWNFNLLSTVAFFAIYVNYDGVLVSDANWTVWDSSVLADLVTTAHAHGVKVVLTLVPLYRDTVDFCDMLYNGSTTVLQTVNQVAQKGIDGVNIDYEGQLAQCNPTNTSFTPQSDQDLLTAFAKNMRAGLDAQKPGYYLSIDTYSGSALGNDGFFNISALNQYVNSFFVMTYDMDYANQGTAPLASCSSFCMAPVSPLGTYYWNDSASMSQYSLVVGAGKVILGQPYYGRVACVGAPVAHAVATSNLTAATYLGSTAVASSPDVQPGTFVQHRDINDLAGADRWDTWYDNKYHCWRELYWADTTTLGQRYDYVLQNNLRGVGFWTLDYAGGLPEVWQLLAGKFAISWSSLGGSLTSGPDASGWPGRLDVFARAQDNSLTQSTWNGAAWTGWSSLGGVITQAPAAVSWGANRIDVFAVGQDQALWHRSWNGSGWSAWSRLGGSLTSAPDVASWGSGRLDVFALGQDKGLWHISFNGSVWSGWQPLGGVLTSDPTAVSWGAGRVDVFGRGQDNALWHKWWDGSSWSGWYSLGGSLTSAADASSCATGHLDIFALGAGSSLQQLGWNGTAWTGWTNLGGQWASDPSTVCQAGPMSTQVFVRGTDNAIWHAAIGSS